MAEMAVSPERASPEYNDREYLAEELSVVPAPPPF
jgi:hypothetical protein